MRFRLFFRGLFLSTCLLVGLSITGQDKIAVRASVEYDLCACGYHTFTVQHAVISDNGKEQKLDFDYFLNGPNTVVKDNDPLSFVYTEQPKDKDGITEFLAKTIYKKQSLELSGVMVGDRVIGTLLVDGSLGHVFYGVKGTVDDMAKLVPDGRQFCIELNRMDLKDIPQALAKWMLAFNKSDQDSKLNKT
jgi:hypothetical protein